MSVSSTRLQGVQCLFFQLKPQLKLKRLLYLLHKQEQQELLKKTAKKHKLVMTGGSDFHGAYNPEPIRIGDYGPDEEALNALLSYKARQRRKQKKLEAAAAVK